MKQTCKFCCNKDVQVHVPDLSVDIEKAVQSGVITQPPVVHEFNNMDIETVMNAQRLREPFDAVDYDIALSKAHGEYSSGTGNVTTATVSTPPDEGSGN